MTESKEKIKKKKIFFFVHLTILVLWACVSMAYSCILIRVPMKILPGQDHAGCWQCGATKIGRNSCEKPRWNCKWKLLARCVSVCVCVSTWDGFYDDACLLGNLVIEVGNQNCVACLCGSFDFAVSVVWVIGEWVESPRRWSWWPWWGWRRRWSRRWSWWRSRRSGTWILVKHVSRFSNRTITNARTTIHNTHSQPALALLTGTKGSRNLI